MNEEKEEVLEETKLEAEPGPRYTEVLRYDTDSITAPMG